MRHCTRVGSRRSGLQPQHQLYAPVLRRIGSGPVGKRACVCGNRPARSRQSETDVGDRRGCRGLGEKAAEYLSAVPPAGIRARETCYRPTLRSLWLRDRCSGRLGAWLPQMSVSRNASFGRRPEDRLASGMSPLQPLRAACDVTFHHAHETGRLESPLARRRDVAPRPT